MARKLLIVDVAALSPAEVGAHTPNLRALAAQGGMYPLREPFPSLTCPSHASLIHGAPPSAHGMIGNCLYSREYAKWFNWNRSSHLLAGTPLWEAARARDPSVRTANLFMRNCADSSCEIRVTERPVYWISGHKQFDFFAEPRPLHAELVQRFGPLPFQNFWGPFADIRSTHWIIGAAMHVMERSSPEIVLVYPPFLDYDGARFGPSSPRVAAALSALDAALVPLLSAARAQDRDVLIVSDYGFEDVDQPVHLNRVLRRAGFLNVEQAPNGDRVDAGTSRAFAVCDNQVAHVYVARSEDIGPVRALLEATPGVQDVLDSRAQAELGVAHPRSSELIATSSARAWFSYAYWFEPERMPDFADCVAVFDKIGTDTCELFLKPGVAGKLHAAKRLAQLKLGLKVPFDIVDINESRVRGARRIARDDPQRGAVAISSWDLSPPQPLAMEHLKDLVLRRLFDQ
jgi:predicted AlkP superfamily pyrophosphatase or phosphodiesterase